MNPVINVHGVPAGSEAAIGTAVQKAIQDPNRKLVEQIKAARNYEAGWVMFDKARQKRHVAPTRAFDRWSGEK